jgi:GNAT superfamily N-acetyltransferase
MQLTIRDLVNKQQMLETYHLVNHMYKNLSLQDFSYNLDEMIKLNNYKIVAGYYQHKLVALSGYWISRMLYCGRYLQLSNFVCDSQYRNNGFGAQIIKYLETKAIKLQCNKIVLDSYIENKKSHAFYYKHGFYIRGLHFMKDLI